MSQQPKSDPKMSFKPVVVLQKVGWFVKFIYFNPRTVLQSCEYVTPA